MARKTFGIFLVMVAAGFITVGVFGARHDAAFFRMLPAQVGVTLGIAPNPYNTLNDQLNAKQQQTRPGAGELGCRSVRRSRRARPGVQSGSSPLVGYLVIAVGALSRFSWD
jgi:hypothetical protein